MAALYHGHRKFDFGEDHQAPELPKGAENFEQAENLVKYVRDQIIGEGAKFSSPFGSRKLIYCDFTASGKSVRFIEEYINDQVLSLYANTHTTTSITGRQTSFYRNEAREIIKRALNGNEDNILLFSGTGATGAVHKLIDCLGLTDSEDKIVVFVGPFEHHSNILPWRELGAKVITIPENTKGQIDIIKLEEELKNHAIYKIKIGSFSAASNITGVLADQNEITACLHKYDALAFWDFAAAGPYVPIDMNPLIEGPNRNIVYKDAIFISPHKFLGGVGTPGLLLARRELFKRSTPKECGGGTVFFVTRNDHRYLRSIEEREEGGTPDIVGSIRCGLVFQLKQQFGDEFIKKREFEFVEKAKQTLLGYPGFVLLGPSEIDRLPIFSFLIQHKQSGLFLHYNFVCSLLNDLFGIQVRGGCVCAGPYAQELLGVNYDLSKLFEESLLKVSLHNEELEDILPRERDRKGSGSELIRPGFVRLNFHYSLDDKTFRFILSALQIISTDGWKLLPYYKFNVETGQWVHNKWSMERDRKWLGAIRFFNSNGEPEFNYPTMKLKNSSSVHENSENLPITNDEYYSFCLNQAKEIVDNVSSSSSFDIKSESLLFDDNLRWFLLPSEANEYLSGSELTKIPKLPFSVKIYESTNPTTNENELNSNELLQEDENPTDLLDFGDYDDKSSSSIIKSKISSSGGFKFHVPPKRLMHSTLDALLEHDMIKHGDRVIACVSGGKDSLSMLHILKYYQYYMKAKGVEFDLAAATVDPQTPSTFDPSPLKVYMKALGMTYFYLSDSIMERARNADECKSICSYCSRMKRGILYSCARKEGYNVLALGQHLDDLAESFIMSLLYNGSLRTMKANYTIE